MKPVYSSNKKGPRMKKGKFSKMVVTKELWKRFTETYEEYKNMSWDDFYKSWLEIAQTIREEAIYNPLGVKLEKFTGEIKLQFLPYNYKANDHATSEELGEKVNHLNIVTKGKVAKIIWERRWAVRFNKVLKFYAFDETRELKKMAKEHIDNNPNALRVSATKLSGYSHWRPKNI